MVYRLSNIDPMHRMICKSLVSTQSKAIRESRSRGFEVDKPYKSQYVTSKGG